ncbi:MAG: hypothetical protein AAFX55_09100 [Bacteroidota bacterium]
MKIIESLKKLNFPFRRLVPLLPIFIFLLFFASLIAKDKEVLINPKNIPNDIALNGRISAIAKWYPVSYSAGDYQAIIEFKAKSELFTNFKISYFWESDALRTIVGINSDRMNNFLKQIEDNPSSIKRKILDTTGFNEIRGLPTFKRIFTEEIINEKLNIFSKNEDVPVSLLTGPSYYSYNFENQMGLSRAFVEELFWFEYNFYPKLRIENILILATTALLLSFLLSQLPQFSKNRNEELNKKDELELLKNLPKLILFDLKVSEDTANELYNRSSILLISGIVMAIVGIVVFSIRIPDIDVTMKDNELTNYLTKAIGPSLMLLFIESVAFFLLRQYRVLIEDFKYFHKLFLKRLNYAQAYHLISQTDIQENIRASLLKILETDALNVKLGKDETTENLESIKIASKDDPSLLIKELINLIDKIQNPTNNK